MIQIGNLLDLSVELGGCLERNFPTSQVYVVEDASGEDPVYSLDQTTHKPMFDMLISKARKFLFVWYYMYPENGQAMVQEMKEICLSQGMDIVVKYPNIPVKKPGWPSIIRYGKHPAGMALERFILKGGNPNLEDRYYTPEDLRTYRNYAWYQVDGALDRILAKSKEMVAESLRKRPELLDNVVGYCLYAGCAYSLAYPQLGFGMRDIDVQVFFSPARFTNTRAALTRPCGIKEFGEPAYFKGKTRWLDIMWNSLHTLSGDFPQDVRTYMGEMRRKSDRWATMSQRPFFDLTTKQLIYTPRWIETLNGEGSSPLAQERLF